VGPAILLFFSSQKPGAGMVGECIGIAYVARQNVNALCRLIERRSPGAVSGPDRERFLPLTGRVAQQWERAQ